MALALESNTHKMQLKEKDEESVSKNRITFYNNL